MFMGLYSIREVKQMSGPDIERLPDSAEDSSIHEDGTAGDVAEHGKRVLSDHLQIESVRVALALHAVRRGDDARGGEVDCNRDAARADRTVIVAEAAAPGEQHFGDGGTPEAMQRIRADSRIFLSGQ